MRGQEASESRSADRPTFPKALIEDVRWGRLGADGRARRDIYQGQKNGLQDVGAQSHKGVYLRGVVDDGDRVKELVDKVPRDRIMG
jgi:hypothetical protein